MKKTRFLCWNDAGTAPNLNLIENLWNIVKDKVSYEQLSSDENLRQAIKEV